MKTFIILSMLALLSIHSMASAQGWEWVNPLPTGLNYNDVVLFDQNEFLIGGMAPVFIRSTDAGVTWNVEQVLQDVAGISKFQALNNSTFMLCQTSKKNVIFSSTDRLKTYKLITPALPDSILITDIQAIQPDILLLFAASRFASFIYRSVDEGKTWSYIQCPFYNGPHPFIFRNAQKGIIHGPNNSDGTVYVTTDGGATWLQSTPITGIHNEGLKPLLWTNDSTVWASTSKAIQVALLRSTDGGMNWEINKTLQSVGISDFVLIPGSKNLLSVGSKNGYCYLSNDDGKNWSLVYSNFNLQIGLAKGSFLDSLNGIVVGSGGFILITHDGGITWDNLDRGIRGSWTDLFCFDENNIIVLGDNQENGFNGVIIRTTNAGATWKRDTLSLSQTTCLAFTDRMHGWLGGAADGWSASSPMVYKTIDGGAAWIPAYRQYDADSTMNYVNDMSFINDQEGSVIGYKTLLITSNGGTTWENRSKQLSLLPNSYLERVVQTATDQIWLFEMTGDFNNRRSIVLHSANAGMTWDTLLIRLVNIDSKGIPTGSEIKDLIVKDKDHIWIVVNFNNHNISSSDSIYRSIDNGAHWTGTEIPFTISRTKSMFFVDADYGFFADYRTTDGGMTWKQYPGFNNLFGDYSRFFFLDQYSGWAVNQDGAILKTKNGGINAVHSIGTMEKNFQLAQNYPNPAHGMTNIELRITNNQHQNVVLKVYDIFGREIATLANEQLEAGNYSKTFNSSSLPAGVYYYRLVVGDQVTTKKMIVMK